MGEKLLNFNVDVREADFDVNFEIKRIKGLSNRTGALVSFLGVVRDTSRNNALKFMEIEHYPGMTENVLRKFCFEAANRWDLESISLIHRIGKLYPSENIVLLIVTSVHRAEAFHASDFIMDFLKSEAPFWKKETSLDGSNWINESQVDRQRLLRW